ncbi:uncharacterized protein N7506_004773 [Penicillium brevicompactum]|uniref:uncharacterized protein n=1 Tax=Penicillium brevicompactum TaxID=5074 RepID=UPI00253FB5C2|nr:uncharacterized protein N7506_004773 [Penicillium brevicompactum]KAJ5336751.1 hypothetical protein N7506_004773 [Penicillium brevicompactum]
MQPNTLSLLFAITCVTAATNGASIDPALESLYSVPTWVVEAMNSAEPTAWASSFSVQKFESTKLAAIGSYGSTATQDWATFTESSATATATATSTSTSSSSSSSGASSISVATGGAPSATGDVLLGLAGAAGILGLAIAL